MSAFSRLVPFLEGIATLWRCPPVVWAKKFSGNDSLRRTCKFEKLLQAVRPTPWDHIASLSHDRISSIYGLSLMAFRSVEAKSRVSLSLRADGRPMRKDRAYCTGNGHCLAVTLRVIARTNRSGYRQMSRAWPSHRAPWRGLSCKKPNSATPNSKANSVSGRYIGRSSRT